MKLINPIKIITISFLLLTVLYSNQFVFPVSKTEFIIQNNNTNKLVDLTGKDFILISLREYGADGRVYAIESDGVTWLTGVISSGAKGHRTPIGVHYIKYRRRFHRSLRFKLCLQ